MKDKMAAFSTKHLIESESNSCRLSYLSCPVASILMALDMRYNSAMKIPRLTIRKEIGCPTVGVGYKPIEIETKVRYNSDDMIRSLET